MIESYSCLVRLVGMFKFESFHKTIVSTFMRQKNDPMNGLCIIDLAYCKKNLMYRNFLIFFRFST